MVTYTRHIQKWAMYNLFANESNKYYWQLNANAAPPVDVTDVPMLSQNTYFC